MAEIKSTIPDTIATVVSTELNSLANNGQAISSSPVSNNASGELFLFGAFELYLNTQGTARVAGAYVELYLVPSLDDTNFAYGSGSLLPAVGLKIGVFQFDAAVTARRGVIYNVPLPPLDFHFVLRNGTGQALASSGNTLKMRRYNRQVV